MNIGNYYKRETEFCKIQQTARLTCRKTFSVVRIFIFKDCNDFIGNISDIIMRG